MSRRTVAPRLCIVSTVALVALSGCAGGTSPITSSASATLSQQVAAIRAAAEADNPAAVESALAELRVSVETLQRNGQLSAARGATILVDAAAVEGQLPSLPIPTTTTTTTTPEPTAPPHPHHGGPGAKGGKD